MSELLRVNGIDIEKVPDIREVSRRASAEIVDLISTHHDMSLLVPTGSTPVETYARLTKSPESIFKTVTFFNMDEYCRPDGNCGYKMLDPANIQSYRAYMKKHILKDHPNITSWFPDEIDIEYPGTYDETIDAHGGIDLCLNTFGEDGHTFGFNFPTDPEDPEPEDITKTVTRLVRINESTKEVNQRLTKGPVPDYAVTTGIATGMASRRVLMIVSGARKAKVLSQVLNGEPSSVVPAAVLRDHPNCRWIVDEAAASLL